MHIQKEDGNVFLGCVKQGETKIGLGLNSKGVWTSEENIYKHGEREREGGRSESYLLKHNIMDRNI